MTPIAARPSRSVRLMYSLSAAALLAAVSLASTAHAGIVPVSAAQCAQMKARKVITPANPVPCSRLATVSFDYTDFDGAVRNGSVVVLDAVAPQVESLFGELLLRSVPIAGAQPLEHFDGDDEKSMAANNTSAFNGRPMTGGGGWSKHAYGAAIDINPLQNPYVTKAGTAQQEVLPPASAAQYVQRAPVQAGMAEDVVGAFYDHGFLIWGGNWKQPIDYQHFEIGSREFIRKLATLPKPEARAEFERYVARYRSCAHKNEEAHAPAADSDDDAPEDTSLRDSCAARLRR
ncbi:M15 family metallopeptidase [Herbaspirillum sp. LeCh32-8]|uniref:M15 family metallopeptidase n=1 Tax=Herbaspirillum sp. LeCh32-8 TaxID=2821356 RepID=UPI001AE38552|nr:M15 family metallopeptidase [Herbaspirillum sp. LeCh32-8]MBP0600157.1 M15 family metallopeptidase [Herbaspirillum sp. LeCh32-8]